MMENGKQKLIRTKRSRASRLKCKSNSGAVADRMQDDSASSQQSDENRAVLEDDTVTFTPMPLPVHYLLCVSVNQSPLWWSCSPLLYRPKLLMSDILNQKQYTLTAQWHLKPH